MDSDAQKRRRFKGIPKVKNKKVLEIALRSGVPRAWAGSGRGGLNRVGFFNAYDWHTEDGPIGERRGSWQQKTAGAGR